jgi:uncharacterized protein
MRKHLILALFASAALAQQPEKKHILFLGGSEGFAHDSVSHAMYTLAKIGEESGVFDVRFHTDTELVTKEKLKGNKKNLDWFDAVMFYTQGDLPLSDQQKADLMAFVKEDGKGILAAHSGTDSFRNSWPEYVEMVGGAFNHHPWHQEVRVIVDDRQFPATRHFGPSIQIHDEIYQLNRYSRDKVRVLMRLDTSTVDMTKPNVERTDGDYAMTWVRELGKGRVFTSVLGHRNEVWDRPDIQKMWLEAVLWTLHMSDGETKPLPLPTD